MFGLLNLREQGKTSQLLTDRQRPLLKVVCKQLLEIVRENKFQSGFHQRHSLRWLSVCIAFSTIHDNILLGWDIWSLWFSSYIVIIIVIVISLNFIWSSSRINPGSCHILPLQYVSLVQLCLLSLLCQWYPVLWICETGETFQSVFRGCCAWMSL